MLGDPEWGKWVGDDAEEEALEFTDDFICFCNMFGNVCCTSKDITPGFSGVDLTVLECGEGEGSVEAGRAVDVGDSGKGSLDALNGGGEILLFFSIICSLLYSDGVAEDRPQGGGVEMSFFVNIGGLLMGGFGSVNGSLSFKQPDAKERAEEFILGSITGVEMEAEE